MGSTPTWNPDTDAVSIISCRDEIPSPRRRGLNDLHERALRRRRARSGAQDVLRVDGKVPAVLHKLEYIGWDNLVMTTKQSTRAFKTIPVVKNFPMRSDDSSDNDSENEDEDDNKDDVQEEKPVIEILTKVYSRRHSPRAPPPRRRRGGSMSRERPITAAFDMADYRYDDYISDEDVDLFHSTLEPSEPVMVVHSDHLRDAIRAVVAYYPNVKLAGTPLVLSAPFRVLYHHREELAEYRDNQPVAHSPEYTATTAEHIDILLNFLETNNGKEIQREESRHQLDVPMATYDYFWLLLKPGEIVYAKRYDIWTPYVISSVSGGSDTYANVDNYRIHGWFLETTGTKIDRFMESFTVAPWHGEQAIDTLPVIPAAFWKEDLEAQGGLTMREKCIAEGKFYWDLLKGPVYMEYDGLLVNSGSGNRRAAGPTGFMNGRVICDASGFDKYYDQAPGLGPPRGGRVNRRGLPLTPNMDHLPKTLPRCSCSVCDENRPDGRASDSEYVGFEDLDPLVDSPPENDLFYLVLSNTIPGFILGQRRWGHLNVAHLKPVKTDKEAFKYLVLDDEVKMLVKALIGKFANTVDTSISPWGNDFVKNKGEGRIFLLHGSPGVGKTCTAECIAELTNRPLIALTSGDLSVDSFHVEHNLSYFFELGQRYGALVLLDEADVYLEKRRSMDIARNGLVSIFLRALEYYRGLLILTTNRVQSFDSAFLSRIHVALHYKNLQDEDRERIWAANFDRLDRDSDGKIHVSVAAREFIWGSREVRGLKWNGREIRNAMQTALALAESDAQDEGADKTVIAEKHMRAVVKLSKGFKDFIQQTMPSDDTSDGVIEAAGGDDEYDEEQEAQLAHRNPVFRRRRY